MMTRRSLLMQALLASGAAAASVVLWRMAAAGMAVAADEVFAVTHTDDEWRKLLTADQFVVLRKSATERPFTSPLLNEKRRGNFCLLYTSPSPRDRTRSRMPSSA